MTRSALLAVLLTLTGCDKLDELMGKGDAPSGDDDAAASTGAASSDSVAVGSTATPKSEGNALITAVVGEGGPSAGLVADQCNEITDGGPVNGPDCVTQDIKCGQTIVGHTRGGTHNYDTNFYKNKFCWPALRDHNGGDERVYRFVFDDDPETKGKDKTRAILSFDTPCADLDITYMSTPDKSQRCPTIGSNVQTCDMINPKNSPRREDAITLWKGETWYFLVEGAADAEGAFSLTLDCGTTRTPQR